MAHESLKPGDKYLNIQLVGHISVVAFKNNNKTNPKAPDYMGNGVAVWVQTKKASDKKVEESSI